MCCLSTHKISGANVFNTFLSINVNNLNSRLGNYIDFIQGIDQPSEHYSWWNIKWTFINCELLWFEWVISYPWYFEVYFCYYKRIISCRLLCCAVWHYKLSSVVCDNCTRPGPFSPRHIPDHFVLC